MKVRSKYFNFEDLPKKGAAGMYMEPGPKIPGLRKTIADYYGQQDPISDLQPSRVQGPAPIGTPPDTSKIQPGKFFGAKDLQPQQPPREKGNFNPGNAALLAMGAFDALLPNSFSKQTVVQPQMAYNPNPYGQGSQALMAYGGMMPSHGRQYDPWMMNYPIEPVPMVGQQQSQQWMYDNGGYVMGEDENNTPMAKDGNWIQKAVNPAHKGYCTPMTKSTCTPKRKALAKTFKKHHGFHKKKEGGIIPDNMSNFNPHDYEYGGDVNGCAKIKEVGPNYPNADLMEQWLLYAQGGQVDPKPRPKGGKAPIYTNDPNDPRIKNYQDSLRLYNNSLKEHNDTENLLKGYIGKGEFANFSEMPLRGSDKEYILNKYKNDKIKPTAMWRYVGDGDALPAVMSYKKPVQPVEYQAERDFQPSIIKDASGTGRDSKGQFKQNGSDRVYFPTHYDTNVPEPGYNPMNFDPRTNYSATYPEGNQQRSAYFPNREAWQSFVDNNPSYVTDSQVGEGGKRGSATLKNRPMKDGGNVNGGAKIKEVSGQYPNADLLEQWLLYRYGGSLPNAAFGTEMPLAEDPIPKPKPGVAPADTSINWNSRNIKNNQIDKDALIADRIGELLGNAYDPYQGTGRAILGGLNQNAPDSQFVNDLGVRLKSIQSDPGYQKMTPEQRIMRFYQNAGNNKGASTLDQFINRASSLGGNPAAFWQNNATNTNRPTPTINFKNGGVMYDDGGQIDTMWGGSADLESYNPYDGGTVEFNGASHNDGGIGMQYNGNPIEVEGGEYASKDGEGNLHIYGNMFIPGSKTKFKKAAKAIADKEKRYDFLKTKGSDLVNNTNPANRYDQLKFNAGRVMMQGGEMGQQDLASKKEKLASLQKSMLEMASEHGLDPFEMSKGKMKKAKKGASIPYAENGFSDGDGNDPTRADRNMNPGNIKYGKFAKKYGAKKDKDGFAIFPDRNTGMKAMKELLTSPSYKNMSAKDAIRKWTGGNPYRYDLGPITEKKIGEMDPDELSIVMGTMTKGEGTRYGVAPRPIPGTPKNTPTPKIPTFTPYQIPDVPLNKPVPEYDPLDPVPPYDYLNVPEKKPIPSNVEGVGINNVMGEIYAAATNKVEPVPAQRYEPQLFTPYQVSFQDRLNANQSVFNAQQRAVGASNPAALGTLGAQKYAADSAVYADEFRTNQGIASDITNKNIALVNDANLKNLGIADTQMVRQSQAKSKTRELNQMILNSLSDKYAKNSLENKRLAAYENLYDYRFVPQDDGGLSATYFGPNAMFNYSGKGTDQKPQDVRTITRYDAQGNKKGYAEYDESDLREMQRILDINKKKNDAGMIPKLYGK